MSYLVEQPPHCDLLRLSLSTSRFVRCRRAYLRRVVEGLSRSRWTRRRGRETERGAGRQLVGLTSRLHGWRCWPAPLSIYLSRSLLTSHTLDKGDASAELRTRVRFPPQASEWFATTKTSLVQSWADCLVAPRSTHIYLPRDFDFFAKVGLSHFGRSWTLSFSQKLDLVIFPLVRQGGSDCRSARVFRPPR